MMDQERISIGRLKQAYKLNAQDKEALVASLAERNCIDLYYSWREAECYFWAKEHPEARDIGSIYFPGVADLENDLLQERYATKRLLRHFMNLARVEKPRELLQKRFERVLEATYDDTDESYVYVIESIINLIYEEHYYFRGGRGRVALSDDLCFSASPELFISFCNFFDDAIIVDKRVAVRYLSSCGYFLQQEVKGLSRALVERLTADVSVLPSQDDTSNIPPKKEGISVPRKLWAGKAPQTARDAMKKEGFDPYIIAYILHTRLNIASKSEIANLLGTYPSKVTKLLATAALEEIVDS